MSSPWPVLVQVRSLSEQGLLGLASLSAALAAGALIAGALLTGAFLSLIMLPDGTLLGFVAGRSDLGHVVVILNHVGAAEAVLAVSSLFHNKLLEPFLPGIG